MQQSIVIENLSHRFDGRYALKDLSCEVRQGEIFALLGPNGAGKTTTIRLVNGLYTPTSGRISVFGKDSVRQGSQIRRETGVLTETSALYERLTARENLLFFGRVYGMPESLLLNRTDEILDFFALKNRAGERVGTYSKGMKQRLALARAFLTHPRILFLDEPTSSLDPESALQVHELIESISRQDENTVFLCTHHLEEAERLADRVAILNSGQLLALGSVDELARQFNHGLWVEIALLNPAEADFLIAGIRGVVKAESEGSVLRVQVSEEAVIPVLVAELVAQKAQIMSVSPQRVSLEDIYFKLQSEVREGAA
ncbi:MAG TPA: ABC transporter ATP-binding protein [Anaerolineaceae bacterium]|nr:ABC transporter ATP-binding protein [Anaerolineaceae bacterium]